MNNLIAYFRDQAIFNRRMVCVTIIFAYYIHKSDEIKRALLERKVNQLEKKLKEMQDKEGK